MLNAIDLSRADLNLLVLFDAVLAERHVGRAAERLNLTASAVSHGLGRLRRLLNDPLFLKTPKGVVPSARAVELGGPVAEILARVRNVVSTAEPFDPATSTRRFMIGAPDATSAVFLPPLLAKLTRVAPRIDIGLRQLLPQSGTNSPTRAWEPCLVELEARTVDLAILPVDEVPARFAERTLYEEEFVIAARAGHPYLAAPSLKRFCEMQHLVVSLSGEPHGFVDDALAARGLKRRVAVTVPNFMFALNVVAETDLIAALPRTLVAARGPHVDVGMTPAPLSLPRYRLRAIMPKVALMDAGLAWLFGKISEVKLAGLSRKR